MFTNTFTPHVGGVARSVAGFTAEHRRCGHRVMVVAPEFEGWDEDETDVLRFPAIQQFSGSDFSVPIPVPGLLAMALEDFAPDVVHSHHPFLLGDTALRVAASRALPVVFTHHTLYERYTHYVPGDSVALRRAAIDLAVGYSNLCDAVIAPSESVRDLLRRRGVAARIEAIPTGVEVEIFAAGERARGRQRHGIPADAFVVGHVGRLAPEKNLDFLARAVARFLVARPEARFLVAGRGPSRDPLAATVTAAGAGDRLHLVGVVESRAELADVYAAMDVFAFASQSETQGMVLTEAMAAGVPVVAVDASGAREVVHDGVDGRLLPEEDEATFVAALAWVAELSPARREEVLAAVSATAQRFSLRATAERTRALYRELIDGEPSRPVAANSPWARARRRFAQELEIWRNVGHAAGATLERSPREPR